MVAFFYTRCDNPNKCSLTITKLGRLQRRLADLGLDGRIQTAAITYDPEFDLPARLRAYGENRGVVFSPSDRLFRTRGALAAAGGLLRARRQLRRDPGQPAPDRAVPAGPAVPGGRALLLGCSGTSRTCSLRRQASPNGHDSMRRVRNLSGPDELTATLAVFVLVADDVDDIAVWRTD